MGLKPPTWKLRLDKPRRKGIIWQLYAHIVRLQLCHEAVMVAADLVNWISKLYQLGYKTPAHTVAVRCAGGCTLLFKTNGFFSNVKKLMFTLYLVSWKITSINMKCIHVVAQWLSIIGQVRKMCCKTEKQVLIANEIPASHWHKSLKTALR